MATKTLQKGKDQILKDELKEIKNWKKKEPTDRRLIEIAKHFAGAQQWDLALESVQLISNEKERNLLIADLIEAYLLPADEMTLAKKFAKFLTPALEIESFVWIMIALADHNAEQAQKIAERLPSPLSRNFAFLRIMESYLRNREKSLAEDLRKLMIENIRTIYDNKTRCSILRELALNLFLPNNEKEHAKEMAYLIPDETIRNEVLSKINRSK